MVGPDLHRDGSDPVLAAEESMYVAAAHVPVAPDPLGTAYRSQLRTADPVERAEARAAVRDAVLGAVRPLPA